MNGVFSTATFGYDAEGKKTYLAEIKADVIDEASREAKEGVAAIKEAVDRNWQGSAAEQFKTALEKDANAIATALEELYVQLVAEVNNLGAAIADFDNGLMSDLMGEE